MNNRELTMAEEHLYADVKQAISAIENILRTAKIGYENSVKTGEGINNVSNSLAKDIMWFVPNRCPDLLTYAQQVRDEEYKRMKK